jgi:DNA-directed RNA polymerase specialized sigma24 family protein
MAADDSITQWIDQLKGGNQNAAQPLWERYFHRLVGLARKKLQHAPRRAADEEDVALSAFDTFCRGAEQGRFPRLHDRDDLWRLLVVITARKAIDQMRKKANEVRGESGFGPLSAASDEPPLEQVLGNEPTPEFAAEVAEEVERFLDRLDDDELRRVAIWKMEGYTNDEIAQKLGCVARSVERRLWVIRVLLRESGA